MKISILHAGYCVCPEHLAIQGGRWRGIHFPAMFALLEHERLGPMLFDTGYSRRFFEETRSFPNSFYRRLTPVTLQENDLAVNQLGKRGIRPQDITRIFISHFHADHIAALADFDRACFVFLPEAYDRLRGLRGWQAVARAFLPGLIPADFDTRASPLTPSLLRSLPPEYAPFETGYDILGDGSVMAVELPGHAAGQMGLFVRDQHQAYFFVADASWLGRGIENNIAPHRLADLLFDDGKAYRATLSRLHAFHAAHGGVQIIPSHCQETLDRYL